MTTRVALAKWGNNLAIRLPKAVVEAMNVRTGSEVSIEVSKGRLVATPVRARPSLEELVRRITPANRHDATEWGGPVGGEVW